MAEFKKTIFSLMFVYTFFLAPFEVFAGNMELSLFLIVLLTTTLSLAIEIYLYGPPTTWNNPSKN